MKVLHSYLIITAFPRPSYRLIFLIPPLSSFVLPELCDIAIASHLNRYFIALTYHFSLLIFLSPDFNIQKRLSSLGSPYLSPSFPFYCQFVWFSYSSFYYSSFSWSEWIWNYSIIQIGFWTINSTISSALNPINWEVKGLFLRVTNNSSWMSKGSKEVGNLDIYIR